MLSDLDAGGPVFALCMLWVDLGISKLPQTLALAGDFAPGGVSLSGK